MAWRNSSIKYARYKCKRGEPSSMVSGVDLTRSVGYRVARPAPEQCSLRSVLCCFCFYAYLSSLNTHTFCNSSLLLKSFSEHSLPTTSPPSSLLSKDLDAQRLAPVSTPFPPAIASARTTHTRLPSHHLFPPLLNHSHRRIPWSYNCRHEWTGEQRPYDTIVVLTNFLKQRSEGKRMQKEKKQPTRVEYHRLCKELKTYNS